ncbi:hypothetical protein V1511DRAFT_510720 [Dipodascopsis uninucleata]
MFSSSILSRKFLFSLGDQHDQQNSKNQNGNLIAGLSNSRPHVQDDCVYCTLLANLAADAAAAKALSPANSSQNNNSNSSSNNNKFHSIQRNNGHAHVAGSSNTADNPPSAQSISSSLGSDSESLVDSHLSSPISSSDELYNEYESSQKTSSLYSESALSYFYSAVEDLMSELRQEQENPCVPPPPQQHQSKLSRKSMAQPHSQTQVDANPHIHQKRSAIDSLRSHRHNSNNGSTTTAQQRSTSDTQSHSALGSDINYESKPISTLTSSMTEISYHAPKKAPSVKFTKRIAQALKLKDAPPLPDPDPSAGPQSPALGNISSPKMPFGVVLNNSSQRPSVPPISIPSSVDHARRWTGTPMSPSAVTSISPRRDSRSSATTTLTTNPGTLSTSALPPQSAGSATRRPNTPFYHRHIHLEDAPLPALKQPGNNPTPPHSATATTFNLQYSASNSQLPSPKGTLHSSDVVSTTPALSRQSFSSPASSLPLATASSSSGIHTQLTRHTSNSSLSGFAPSLSSSSSTMASTRRTSRRSVGCGAAPPLYVLATTRPSSHGTISQPSQELSHGSTGNLLPGPLNSEVIKEEDIDEIDAAIHMLESDHEQNRLPKQQDYQNWQIPRNSSDSALSERRTSLGSIDVATTQPLRLKSHRLTASSALEQRVEMLERRNWLLEQTLLSVLGTSASGRPIDSSSDQYYTERSEPLKQENYNVGISDTGNFGPVYNADYTEEQQEYSQSQSRASNGTLETSLDQGKIAAEPVRQITRAQSMPKIRPLKLIVQQQQMHKSRDDESVGRRRSARHSRHYFVPPLSVMPKRAFTIAPEDEFLRG